MVNFIRRRNSGEDYSTLPEHEDAVASKWNRKKILGNVAATLALTGIALGLGSADANNRVEQTTAPEVTHVTDGPSSDMPGFVQLEGEDKYRQLVKVQPAVAVHQDFAPNFTAPNLNDAARTKLIQQLENEAEFLRTNENATTTLKVRGFASDESGFDSINGDGNLGKPSESNRILAEQRRDITYEKAIEFMQEFGDRVKVVKSEAREVLLTEQDIVWLAEIARKRSMSSEIFLNAYQNNRGVLDLSKDEAERLFGLVDANRGADILPERNLTGIDPASDTVILKQVAPTYELKANPEMSHRNALKLLPFAGAVIATAGLAVSARRRMKAKKYPETEQIHNEIKPERSSVDANSHIGVVVDPLAEKIDWVMNRSRDYSSLTLDNYLYIGKHRRVSKKMIKIGAAVATIAAVTGLAKPSWSTVVEPVIPVSKKPVYPLDESKLSYAKKSIFQFRFGRRFVYDEQPVRSPYQNHEQVSRPNVFMFDTEGNLLQ